MSHPVGDFFHDIVEGIRERNKEMVDEAVFEAKIIGIEKATAALCEAKVEDEKIINLLQKYWDLRPSEAREFLQQERNS